MGLLRSQLVKGPAAPLHVHTLEDEAWIVENGEIEYEFTTAAVDGDVDRDTVEAVVVGPADFVFVPRGYAHAMTVLSETAVVWTMVVPGGLEDFLLDRDEADPAKRTGAGVDLEGFGITIYPASE